MRLNPIYPLSLVFPARATPFCNTECRLGLSEWADQLLDDHNGSSYDVSLSGTSAVEKSSPQYVLVIALIFRTGHQYQIIAHKLQVTALSLHSKTHSEQKILRTIPRLLYSNPDRLDQEETLFILGRGDSTSTLGRLFVDYFAHTPGY